jgi:protein-disulfide isomerase
LSVMFTFSAVVVAVVVVIFAVRREFYPRAQPRAEPITEPIPVENWGELIASGHAVGPPDAPVTILVFADFECVACRSFAEGPLREIRERYADSVRVIHRHWPLPYHRFAYPAARASECAAAQGRFWAFHDLLYEKQDSLGLKSFSDFAVESGVSDIPMFEACNSRTEPIASITSDSSAVRGIGGTGTPTVLVNGLRLSNPRLLEPLVEGGLNEAYEQRGTDGTEPAAPSAAWETAPSLELVPELRIDGVSAGLTRIGSVAVARDGSMAVSQPETASVIVYDAGGTRIGLFGHRAGGLGEVDAVSDLGWVGDTLWVHDIVRERLVFGTLPARVARTAPFSREAVPVPSEAETLPAATAMRPLAVYPDGSIYASALVPGERPEQPVSSTVRRYVRLDPSGHVSRLIAEVPEEPRVRIETRTTRGSARVPFLRGALHAVSSTGEYVATVTKRVEGPHGGSFKVVVQGPMGDTVHARSYPFVGVPIPPALADSVIEARAERMESRALAREFRDESPVPPVHPPVARVVVGNDGTVWLALRATGNEREHLVLAPGGVPLGVAALPPAARVVAVDGANLWVVESDAARVESLVRYRLLDGEAAAGTANILVVTSQVAGRPSEEQAGADRHRR